MDKTAAAAVPFDQPSGVPLSALTWSLGGSGVAQATSYAVIIVDPDKTLPATIAVTLTPTNGTLVGLEVDPASGVGPYTIAAALTDGTPNKVTATTINGTPTLASFLLIRVDFSL